MQVLISYVISDVWLTKLTHLDLGYKNTFLNLSKIIS